MAIFQIEVKRIQRLIIFYALVSIPNLFLIFECRRFLSLKEIISIFRNISLSFAAERKAREGSNLNHQTFKVQRKSSSAGKTSFRHSLSVKKFQTFPLGTMTKDHLNGALMLIFVCNSF